MTTQVLQFKKLSVTERTPAVRLGRIAKDDRLELRIRGRGGADRTLALPPGAATLVETLLERLFDGDRVALLTEEQELSPKDAATILGISRPLVVHRMDSGDLPFRYVGKHRRTKLNDVLTFKARLDAQRTAMQALADDAEDLQRQHGV